MPLPRLLVLSLGGTITMTGSGPGGIQPKLGAADLVATVPALAGIAEIEARSPFRLGSSSLTIENVATVAGEIRAGFDEGSTPPSSSRAPTPSRRRRSRSICWSMTSARWW